MVDLSEALDMEALDMVDLSDIAELSDMVDLSEALDMVDLSDIADLSDMVDLSEALDMLVWLEEGWLEQLPRWPVSTDLPSVESTGAKNNHYFMLCKKQI